MQTLDHRAVRVAKPALRRVEIVGDYVPESGRVARRFLISQETRVRTRVRGLRADKRDRTEKGQSKERFHLNVDPGWRSYFSRLGRSMFYTIRYFALRKQQ